MSQSLRSIAKPRLPDVIDGFRSYYERHPAWGRFHVVLDDGNHADHFVRSTYEDAMEGGDPEEIRLATLLLAMSRTQRGKLADLVC